MPTLFPSPPSTTKDLLLPEFSSLLITGSYHSSAPVHLSLSSAQHQSIIISPSKSAFSQDLQQFKDAWLTANSGHGSITALSSKISVFDLIPSYPPTVAHLCLLVAVLCVPSTNDAGPGFISTKLESMQAFPATQFILVEPSRYLLIEEDADATPFPPTLSSYFNILNRIFTSIFAQPASSPSEMFVSVHRKLVVFDSGIDHLRLPLRMRPPTPDDDAVEESGDEGDEGDEDHKSEDEQEDTTYEIEGDPMALCEILFRWVGVFEDDPMNVPSSQGEEEADEGTHRQIRLYRPRSAQDESDMDQEPRILSWIEKVHAGDSARDGIDFIWI
ncbi:hypothetical protein D9613_005598 [Agrocybe pediades]|uniref:Uncharacterized protein n=1 Tax=Agrocybe pediades TaxID=84607 RepID=A0A8H4QYF9_9AGAR|nr:hypothetical protein D9613_005598 [Agrocybe pediades]